MSHLLLLVVRLSLCALFCLLVESASAEDPQQSGSSSTAATDAAEADGSSKHTPSTVAEARSRARILHEAMHGALQVMHRDYFREDEGLVLPSRSLEDVFSELASTYGVELRWIAVDLRAMNVDNDPETEFEKEAVRILKSGKDEYEAATDDEYRFVGKIRLSATCLACHASRRSSNDARSAGLVITMPLKKGATVGND